MSERTDRFPVTVGVDGSSSALDAVRWAAREAARVGTGLRLVHTYVLPVADPYGFADRGALDEALRGQGEQFLEQARDVAVETVPGIEVDLVVRQSQAAVELLGWSSRSSMTVVGSRGLGGFTGLLLGSIAVALVSHAQGPVVVVRGRPGGPVPVSGPVVVGVDGSPNSEQALAFAVDEAVARGVELIAVHAWTDVTPSVALLGGVGVVDLDAVREDVDAMLAGQLAGWQAKHPDLRITRRIVRDGPANALLDAALSASMVVVGARGRGGFLGLLLGSTSQKLLYHAGCPVVVVRPHPRVDQEA